MCLKKFIVYKKYKKNGKKRQCNGAKESQGKGVDEMEDKEVKEAKCRNFL